MFLTLADINEQVKKQIVRIFFNCACHLTESFDDMQKAASAHAVKSESLPFQTLIKGFESNDHTMAITLLKFINQMIFISSENEKQ